MKARGGTRGWRAVFTAVAFAALGTGSAGAAVGDLTFAGCLANDATQGCTDIPNSPLASLSFDIAISPDGTSVYATGTAGTTEGELSFFRRADDGSLTFVSCVANDSAQGCTDLSGAPLRGADAVAVSPDGDSVYVASAISQSVSHFFRAPDGTLTYEGCDSSDGADGCVDVGGADKPLSNINDLAVSPNGASVYAVGTSTMSGGGGRIVNFVAAPQGQITFESCRADDSSEGCGSNPGQALLGGGSVIAAPGSVYAGSIGYGALSRFSTTSTGQLTFDFCLRDANLGLPSCTGLPGSPLSHIGELDLSPDGGSLYAVSMDQGAITQFSIGADGRPAFVSCLSDSTPSCVDLPNSPLTKAQDLDVTQDGKSVYVASTDADSVSTFQRDSSGALTFAGCQANDLTQGCTDVPNTPLDGAMSVVASPDGKSVYVASSPSQSISVFNREIETSNPPPAELSLELSAKPKEKAGKLSVKATCSVACSVDVQAKGKAGKKFSSKPVSMDLQAGEETPIKLKLKRRVLRKVDDRKGRVQFFASATTADGATASDQLKIKLKP
jgi:6-phosphogluconolactonase (cycloisomerase 2 family)